MKLRVDNLERRNKVFALYFKSCERSELYKRWRMPLSGAIAVSDDEYARKWQQIQMRIAIMETYLRGEIAPNWYNAHWLSNEEANRRKKATGSSPSLRERHESTSQCLPEIAIFAAGYRNSKDIVTAR